MIRKNSVPQPTPRLGIVHPADGWHYRTLSWAVVRNNRSRPVCAVFWPISERRAGSLAAVAKDSPGHARTCSAPSFRSHADLGALIASAMRSRAQLAAKNLFRRTTSARSCSQIVGCVPKRSIQMPAPVRRRLSDLRATLLGSSFCGLQVPVVYRNLIDRQDLPELHQGWVDVASSASRWTESGENAGMQIATYSAPPSSGVL